MHTTRHILDIKLPSSTCWDTAACLASIKRLPPKKQNHKQEGRKARRESVKSQQQDDFDAELFFFRGQPALRLHAFISYLLRRILLCHASVRDCVIGARAAVASSSGVQIPTRTWPAPQRCMMGETEMFDVNCHIALLAPTT